TQLSPGSKDWMSGCPVASWCREACWFFEFSQQPTCPQIRQMRRCTHVSPSCKHSSHPSALGVTCWISSACVHTGRLGLSALGASCLFSCSRSVPKTAGVIDNLALSSCCPCGRPNRQAHLEPRLAGLREHADRALVARRHQAVGD